MIVTILFAIAGLNGLSGAGVIRRLPLLRLGLAVICFVYIYRGILFIPPVSDHDRLTAIARIRAAPIPAVVAGRPDHWTALPDWVGYRLEKDFTQFDLDPPTIGGGLDYFVQRYTS